MVRQSPILARNPQKENPLVELTVKLLPMDRKWGRRIHPTLVVVSERLWLDPDARDAFLDPVVRTLA